MTTIRVLIAEDHALVRAGFRALLDTLPEIEVVAEASNGYETIEQVNKLQPDVVLMDISMPRMNGVEATQRINRDFPQVRVIILSMHATEEYVLQVLRVGAVGYLLKDTAPAEFNLAIRAVANGETYLCSGVAQHVIDYVQRTQLENPIQKRIPNPYEQLTPRQREILQLVVEGHSSLEIGHALNISVKTVERHRTDIMERLNIHDLPGLVRYAVRAGIIPLEE
jgi:DNA-binding NarL/FixJ family response regulator